MVFLTNYNNNDIERLFRHSINVFDRLDEIFAPQRFSTQANTSFPPHNIRQKDSHYVIEMAIAGFSKSEIEITREKDHLVIEGKKEDTTDKDEFITYRGIASRSFRKTFALGESMKVLAADVKDGMLYVALEKEIPEKDRPEKIAIGADEDKMAKVINSVKNLIS